MKAKKIRTCFCLFDISLLAFDENLTYDDLTIKINQLDKKDKWFCHLGDNFLCIVLILFCNCKTKYVCGL